MNLNSNFSSKIALGCGLLALLVGFSPPAQAGFFQFSTDVNVGAIVPLPTSVVGNNTPAVTIVSQGGTSILVQGVATSDPENLDASGVGTDIVFGYVTALVKNASPLEAISIPFTFNVTLTDYLTDTGGVPTGSGVFSISGTLSGTLGAGRKVNLNTINVNPIPALQVGSTMYKLDFNTFVPPGPANTGAIGAHVSIVPEPGTVAMLGCGAVALVLPVARRLRAKRSKI